MFPYVYMCACANGQTRKMRFEDTARANHRFGSIPRRSRLEPDTYVLRTPRSKHTSFLFQPLCRCFPTFADSNQWTRIVNKTVPLSCLHTHINPGARRLKPDVMYVIIPSHSHLECQRIQVNYMINATSHPHQHVTIACSTRPSPSLKPQPPPKSLSSSEYKHPLTHTNTHTQFPPSTSVGTRARQVSKQTPLEPTCFPSP